MELTAFQCRAIAHAGRNPQLIACAGSGKTEVVSGRVVHPVDDDFIEDVRTKVGAAADALRTSELGAAPAQNKCKACDYRGMCTAGRSV